MQSKKFRIAVLILLGFTMFALVIPSQQVLSTAGTTGAVESGSSLKANLGFWVKITQAQENSEYILVPSVTTMGLANVSFIAGSTTHYQGPLMFTSTGTVTLTLYGADGGVSSGAALGQWQITVTNIGDSIVGPDLFTNLISFFLPIIIVMTIVLAFRFRDRLKEFSKK